MFSRTPFEFGRELSGEELVDREDELATVVRVMQERGRLFLIGPRRFGKTSVLRAATEIAEVEGIVVLRHDAEAYPTVQSLAEAIVADGASRLTRTVERAGKKIAQFFAALRPQVNFNPMDGSMSIALAENPSVADQPALLASVLDGLNAMAGQSKRSVAVVIDEFQKVVESTGARGQSGKSAEAQLRASVQRHDNVGYIFAGSKTGLLTEMTGDASRPFYRLGSRLFLGPIPRSDFSVFLADGFASGGFQADADAIRTILDCAADVPYNVQRLAYECWNLLRDGGVAGDLSEQHVEDALAQLVRRDDPFYTQTWNSLLSTQQRALVALVAGEGRGMLSAAVLRSHGLAAATMQTAIRALITKGIVRYEETRGSVRHRLEDPFFGTWVATYVAPARL
ncbi:ATP-binding protein [Bacteroidota bacterium]